MVTRFLQEYSKGEDEEEEEEGEEEEVELEDIIQEEEGSDTDSILSDIHSSIFEMDIEEEIVPELRYSTCLGRY